MSPVKRICVFGHSVMTNFNCAHSEGPGIWLSVWRFLSTHCLYERAAKVLSRLRGCAGTPEPSLLAKAISSKFAWRGPNDLDYTSVMSYNGPHENSEILLSHLIFKDLNLLIGTILLHTRQEFPCDWPVQGNNLMSSYMWGCETILVHDQ